MKQPWERILGPIAGLGALICLVGVGIAATSHHPLAILIVMVGMLLAAPAALVNTVVKIRQGQRKMECERRMVEKQIAQGQQLSVLVPKEVAFSERQRQFWISWRPVVFILGISLVLGLIGGWTVGDSFLAVGFAVWIFLILVGGRKNQETPVRAGVRLADDNGAIFETVRLTEAKAKKLLPPAIFTEWRNYHLARGVVRCCLALWVFAAIVASNFAAVDCIRSQTTPLEGVRSAVGWIGFTMMVTAPVILLVLVAGAFSRWRIRRWERLEENKRK